VVRRPLSLSAIGLVMGLVDVGGRQATRIDPVMTLRADSSC
jgi:hypothetical protein